ncbi:MAG: hypothetical protein AAGC55_17235 [Myxococcota bacterium]
MNVLSSTPRPMLARLLLIALPLCASLWITADEAVAQQCTVEQHEPCANGALAKHRELYVDNEVVTAEMCVKIGEPAMIKVHQGIEDYRRGNHALYVRREGNSIEIAGKPGAPPDTTGLVSIRTGDGGKVVVRVYLTAEMSNATVALEVRHRTSEEQRQRAIERKAEQLCTRRLTDPATVRTLIDEGGAMAKVVEAEANAALMSELLKGYERIPLDYSGPNERGLFIYPVAWIETVSGRHFVEFEFFNRVATDYQLARIAAMNEFRGENHGGDVQFVGMDSNWDGETRVVAPGEIVRGIIEVYEPEKAGAELILEVNEPRGRRGVTGEAIHLPVIRLPDPRPHENVGRKTVTVQALGGMIWVADSINGDRVEATAMTGLGARLVYGFTELINIEFGLTGARSGTAQFDDMTIDGQVGDLDRSAVLGRLHVAGFVRWGDGYQPYVRAGAGAQGVNYSDTFTGGAEPDSPFDFGFFLTLGGGLQIPLGDAFVVGMDLSGEWSAQSDNASRRSFAVGAHLGYGWD